MKRVFIACAALVSMMMVACTAETQTTETAEVVEEAPAALLQTDIAFIDVDYALSQSDIITKEGAALQKKTEKAQESWAKREQTLQADATSLQDKYQRGLITTANAQAEQEKIQKKAVQFQNSAQAEMQKLDEENTVFSNRTRDLLRRAVDEVNADKRYKLIINASALIDADTTYDITSQIIETINKLYAEDNK